MTIFGLFLFCAVLGGSIMILQLAFTLFGFGFEDMGDGVDFSGDGVDFGGDGLDAEVGDAGDAANGVVGHDSLHMELFRILSFRTLLAGVTFFGLSGLASLSAGGSPVFSVLIALLAGFAAIYAVYWLYRKISSIRADGTISEKSLLGAQGKVYIRIPANRSGMGKVQVNQQDRTMEYEAVTPGEMLAAGTDIVITKVISSTSVEVGPV